MMGQARTDHDERAAGLRQLVAGGAESGHVGRGNVLHLVDEQGDPDAEVAGYRGGLGEQFGQVHFEIA